MAFLVFLLCGFAGGLLGGMGMGGGTVLIPLLTIFCGVEQTAAQGVNLVSFLPMSAFALSVHAKSGLLEREGLFWIVSPALLFSVLFSLVAAHIGGEALRRAFGFFLAVLSLFQFGSALSPRKRRKI